MVADIYPNGSSNPRTPVVYNNQMYFLAEGENIGIELYKSDGTASGTELVKDMNPGPISSVLSSASDFPDFIVYDGLMWLVSCDSFGTEPWVSDGTTAGTVMLKNLYVGGSGDPTWLCGSGDKVYFSAWDLTSREELFETDGTTAGTHITSAIYPGGYAEVAGNYSWNDQLFFSASSPASPRELWTLSTPVSREAELNPGSEITLYPNPAYQHISFEWKNDYHGPYQFQVVDLSGRILMEGGGTKANAVALHTLEVGKLAKGFYTLKITERDRSLARKFVVVR
jgi:ELWxxDGT repeat protein